MKTNLSIIALVISLIALTLSVASFRAADIALAKREKQFVVNMTPQMTTIVHELMGTNGTYATPPQTIEELIQPFVTVIEAIGQ